MNVWAGLLLAVSAFFNAYLLLRGPRCRHHWHPADAMIAWSCCWCETERDGMPINDTSNCAEEAQMLRRERDEAVIRASVALQNQARTVATTWDEVRHLPPGSVVQAADGRVFFVQLHDHWPGEVWLCPFSDEYATTLRSTETGSHHLEYVHLPLHVLGVSPLKDQG